MKMNRLLLPLAVSISSCSIPSGPQSVAAPVTQKDPTEALQLLESERDAYLDLRSSISQADYASINQCRDENQSCLVEIERIRKDLSAIITFPRCENIDEDARAACEDGEIAFTPYAEKKLHFYHIANQCLEKELKCVDAAEKQLAEKERTMAMHSRRDEVSRDTEIIALEKQLSDLNLQVLYLSELLPDAGTAASNEEFLSAKCPQLQIADKSKISALEAQLEAQIQRMEGDFDMRILRNLLKSILQTKIDDMRAQLACASEQNKSLFERSGTKKIFAKVTESQQVIDETSAKIGADKAYVCFQEIFQGCRLGLQNAADATIRLPDDYRKVVFLTAFNACQDKAITCQQGMQAVDKRDRSIY